MEDKNIINKDKQSSLSSETSELLKHAVKNFLKREMYNRHFDLVEQIFKLDKWKFQWLASEFKTQEKNNIYYNIPDTIRDFNNKLEFLINYTIDNKIPNITLLNRNKLINILKTNDEKIYENALKKSKINGFGIMVELSTLSKGFEIKPGIYYDQNTLSMVEVLPEDKHQEMIKSEQIVILIHSLKLDYEFPFKNTLETSDYYGEIFIKPDYSINPNYWKNADNIYEKVERMLVPKILLKNWVYLGEL